MGLDDFMDLDSETKKSYTESEDDNEESSNETVVKSKGGPYGYSSFDEYEDTIVGELNQDEKLFKYNLPIYPHIMLSSFPQPGKRYTRSEDKKKVICLSHEPKQLKSIPREILMIDTGECERKLCIDAVSDRVDEDVDPSTTVNLYMFAHTRHIVKMAIGDSMTDDWSLKQKDHVLKSIYNESYTQRFRKKNTVDEKLKHIDHIDQW